MYFISLLLSFAVGVLFLRFDFDVNKLPILTDLPAPTEACSMPACCNNVWAVDRCRQLFPTRGICDAWFEAGCFEVRCQCRNAHDGSCNSPNCR